MVHTPEHGVQTVAEVHKPRSDVSTTSRRSSIRGAKLEAAARRASLLASMNLQRELEEEELVLKHRRRELDLKIQVAKAEAEEKVYSECGETDSSGSQHIGSVHTMEQETLDYTRMWHKKFIDENLDEGVLREENRDQTVTSQTPHSQTVPKRVSPTQHTLDQIKSNQIKGVYYQNIKIWQYIQLAIV